ncbi:hypothetical protein FALCPG4_015009 [Fusarium falciforme]
MLEGWGSNLWIDALCINQNDERERSQQVSMMDEIYSRASRVLIWLGSLGKFESTSLVQFSKQCQGMNRHFKDVPVRHIFGDLLALSAPKFKDFPASTRRGLVQILVNPYWMRKWIIQEILLSGPNACIVTCDWVHPTIPIIDIARGVWFTLTWIRTNPDWFKQQLNPTSGNHEPDLSSNEAHDDEELRALWQFLGYGNPEPDLSSNEAHDDEELRALGRLLGYMDKGGIYGKGIFDLENCFMAFWTALADAKMTYKPESLMKLVDAYRDHICSDQKDNIYALLGLSTLPRGRLVVDYSCTVQRLFNEVWSVVKDDMVGHNEDCLKRALHLPNQHPDWRARYINL